MGSRRLDKPDLLLHPIRLRIVLALSRRRMTAHQIGAALGDVPQATLYRHLGRLAEAGLVEIVEERPVRGTVEKVYTFPEQVANLTPKDMARASKDDHLRYFTAFVASLLQECRHYLAQEWSDPLSGEFGYWQVPLYMSDDEFRELTERVGSIFMEAVANEPAPGMRRRIVTSVVMPDPGDGQPGGLVV